MRRELPGGFELDDDRTRVDVDSVHAFLTEHAYWARGRPRETVERLVLEASRVIGLYEGKRQIGFARTVSDGQSFAYLADVYVLPEYRGHGLGVELVRQGRRQRPVRRPPLAPPHRRRPRSLREARLRQAVLQADGAKLVVFAQ